MRRKNPPIEWVRYGDRDWDKETLAVHKHPSHGWVAPDGHFYHTVFHGDWAAKRLDGDERPFDPRDTNDREDAMDILMDQGWIRMAHDSFSTDTGVNAEQFKTIQELAVGDDNRTFYIVDTENDFDGWVPVDPMRASKSYDDLLKFAAQGPPEGALSELWARKAAREHGVEENPLRASRREPDETERSPIPKSLSREFTCTRATKVAYTWLVGDNIAFVAGVKAGKTKFYLYDIELDEPLQHTGLFREILTWLGRRYRHINVVAVTPGLESLWDKAVETGLVNSWVPIWETPYVFGEIFSM